MKGTGRGSIIFPAVALGVADTMRLSVYGGSLNAA